MGVSVYLDSAAMSVAMRSTQPTDASLSDILSRLIPMQKRSHWDIAFAQNSTQALRAVVEGVVLSGSNAGPVRGVVLDDRMHPVILRCIALLARVLRIPMASADLHRCSGTAGTIRRGRVAVIVPVTCWLTGQVLFNAQRVRDLRRERPNCLIIADAVQAVGNIPREAVGDLLDGEDADVVLGGVHKWLGCSHPLGIAWVRKGLIAKNLQLREWLCLNDFLGDGGGPRQLLRDFPDTFDAKVGLSLASELFKRFPTQRSIDRHYETLASNAEMLKSEFGQLAGCRLFSHDDFPESASAICAVVGTGRTLCRISAALNMAGFCHTFFERIEYVRWMKGRGLRVSAPCAPLTGSELAALKRALAPFRSGRP